MCFHPLQQLVRQFGSDTVCLEMVSDRTQSHKALLPTPASDASCKSRVLLMLLTYWLEVLMTLPWAQLIRSSGSQISEKHLFTFIGLL